MLHIVIPDDEPAVMAPSAAFRKLQSADVQLFDRRPASVDELVERISTADVVINIRSSTKFTREVIERCHKLQMISIWGTGTDNVDLAEAKARSIHVTNTPGVSAIAVAEHTMTLMLAVAKRLLEVDNEVRQGRWPRAMAMQLRGKTLGLIGTGAIGREVARLGKAIGMNVIAWSFRPSGDVAEWVSFEDVFRRSDVVSVHVRQSPDTLGFIGRDQFDLMKPGSLFINTARGAIVKEPALVDALRFGRIAGAGLDVFEQEPLPADSPLHSFRNVVLTPHAAGMTPEAMEAGLALAIDNVFAFIAGRPRNVVV